MQDAIAAIYERMTKISTRRFLARLAWLVLGAAGFVLPKPRGLITEYGKPREGNQWATA